jgi:hypothetical protein
MNQQRSLAVLAVALMLGIVVAEADPGRLAVSRLRGRSQRGPR